VPAKKVIRKFRPTILSGNRKKERKKERKKKERKKENGDEK
jgi:hypothetical protein